MLAEPALYEIAYLAKAEDAVPPDLAEGIKKLVEERKGMIMEEVKPQKIRLSYPIRKQTEAFHGAFKFLIKAEEVEGIKELLEKEEKILRYILTRAKLREVRRQAFGPRTKPAAQLDLTTIDKKLDELLGK